MNYKIIAIDGPAGAGKSTIAKKLSNIIGYTYIDSGAMYRALTLKLINNNVNINNIDDIINIFRVTSIEFKLNNIYLDGIIVNNEIRQNNVNERVSVISAIPKVRDLMVDSQRKFAKSNNVIMDGRDVGTVVFPDASIKLYLTASIEERAQRRYTEMINKGHSVEYENIKKAIQERDYADSTRTVAPLKPSPDAIIIDTSNKSIDCIMGVIIDIIKAKGII